MPDHQHRFNMGCPAAYNLLAQKQQEVPQSLTELYAKSVELMLGRWDQKRT